MPSSQRPLFPLLRNGPLLPKGERKVDPFFASPSGRQGPVMRQHGGKERSLWFSGSAVLRNLLNLRRLGQCCLHLWQEVGVGYDIAASV